MNWKELSGEERYRVVELARRGEVPIKELCQTFGVSRQTLRTAMEKADRAAMEALVPKSPGRKGKSPEQAQFTILKQEHTSLEKELEHWKQKYEVAMTFVDLHRRLLDGKELPGEEKPPKKKRRKRSKRNQTSKGDGRNRTTARMDVEGDGGGDGSEDV